MVRLFGLEFVFNAGYLKLEKLYLNSFSIEYTIFLHREVKF